jgi:acetyl-CoA C-acetyltransferase
MRSVSIIGIGSTAFGRHKEIPLETLAVSAAKDALGDAGVDAREIGALYLGNFIGGVLSGQEVLAGLVGHQLGLPLSAPCSKVEGACASGGIAFRQAWMSVASGLCDFAIAAGVEKMSHAGTARVTEALNCAMDQQRDGPTGLSFPGYFGMAARVYGEAHADWRAHLTAVTRKNKANGLRNPLAQMGEDVSADTVEQSPLVADPLRLYECCPISDGAAAIVIAADDAVKERLSRAGAKAPIRVAATVQTRGAPDVASIKNLLSFEATVEAARQAYRVSGLAPADIDFVELHDCFSLTEILDAEDLGVVPRGQAGAWTREGRTRPDSDMPINVSGGLLAKGHPVGATGVGQLYEAVRQLRGEHANPVKDAGIGMTHNLGGAGVVCTVSILKRADA